MKWEGYYFGLIALVFGFFLPVLPVQGAAGLEITEVFYDAPGSDTGKEWVELTNLAPSAVTIIPGSGTGSWRFFDTSNHTFTLHRGVASIAPNESIILAVDPALFLTAYPTYTGTIYKVALSLPNSEANLKLSSDKGVTWFFERSYSSTTGGGGTGQTLTWQGTAWQESSTGGGNPGQYLVASPEPTASSTPSSSPSSEPTPNPSPSTPAPEPSLSPTASSSPSPITTPLPTSSTELVTSSPESTPSPVVTTAPTPTPVPTPSTSPIPPPQFSVTEIFYNPPGTDRDQEWVEFVNSGPFAVILRDGRTASAWRLIIGSSRHTLRQISTAREVTVGQKFVITTDLEIFQLHYPDYQGILFVASFSLPNEQGLISLVVDGTTIGQTSYSATEGGDGDGRSLERLPDGRWQASTAILGTPGQDPSPAHHTSPSIAINEFLPNPADGDDEWIELQNLSEVPIDLTGWLLDDGRGRSKAYRIARAASETVISPQGLLVLTRDRTNIRLSDTQGELILRRPDNQIENYLPYTEPPTGHSWIRLIDGGSQWTRTPTPNAANIASQITALETVTVEQFIDRLPVVLTTRPPVLVDQTKALAVGLNQLPTEDGWFLEVQGEVAASHARSADITNGVESLHILFRLATGEKPSIHKGDHLQIAGVLEIRSEGPQLIVTDPQTIQVISLPKLVKPPKKTTQKSKKTTFQRHNPPAPVTEVTLPPDPIVVPYFTDHPSATSTNTLPLGMMTTLVSLILISFAPTKDLGLYAEVFS